MDDSRLPTAQDLDHAWQRDRRWTGVDRFYRPEDVVRLRGTTYVEHSLARQGAQRLWDLLNGEEYVPALGAYTGMQAVQMVKAGLKAIYVSGWQVAAESNLADETYPDQSLYPVNSVPAVVRRLNRALLRADQIEHAEGLPRRDWLVPLVADAEAGFGGPLNAFELTKALIEAGASAIHFEDQLASAKKCGHMGGKVLVPPSHQRRCLTAARLASDVLDVPVLLIARTDARSATLLSSDADPRDKPFLTGERTIEGYWVIKAGLDAAIERSLAYAPYADVLWFETDTPNLEEATRFARAIHEHYPGKLLAYNCSPSFHWKEHLDDDAILHFQRRLGALGYRFQFVTLAGFHTVAQSMFELADAYRDRGMAAYVAVQEREFAMAGRGYSAVRHQREVGTTYFDEVARAIVGREASTVAHRDSTEARQFGPHGAPSTNGVRPVTSREAATP